MDRNLSYLKVSDSKSNSHFVINDPYLRRTPPLIKFSLFMTIITITTVTHGLIERKPSFLLVVDE